jgi:SAM-dependent methyltransferase
MTDPSHWDAVYATRAETAVSWYEPVAEVSRRLVRATGVPRNAAIVDVGAGASTLVDGLLADGYTGLTLLDVADAALAIARRRLGARAAAVRWRTGDVLGMEFEAGAYRVWHDRAMFHFLVTAEARALYLARLRRALAADGQVVIATFGRDGPERCSGLPVQRYDAPSLATALGGGFVLEESLAHTHPTPAGATQSFVYARFRRLPVPAADPR